MGTKRIRVHATDTVTIIGKLNNNPSLSKESPTNGLTSIALGMTHPSNSM
jgi:hypothetical protein